MAEVTCEDGRVLGLEPVPVLGRDGVAYEHALRLLLDGRPYGEVGERCGWTLLQLARRLRAAQGALPPTPLQEAAGPELAALLPRDPELLALRARDPDDLPGRGALRAVGREVRSFGPRRGWTRAPRVLVEAWGDDGTGVRAELDPAGLLALVEALLGEMDTGRVDASAPPDAH